MDRGGIDPNHEVGKRTASSQHISGAYKSTYKLISSLFYPALGLKSLLKDFKMSQSNMVLRVNSITKNFGEKRVLSDVSLSFCSDQIVGILGPNGAGKTTLLKIINNLVRATQGSVTIDERPIKMTDIGFVPEGVRHFYWPLFYPSRSSASIPDVDHTASGHFSPSDTP